MSGPNLDSYIEVKDRLVLFYERFPEGSLDTTYEFVEVAGQQYVICNAYAYRTPDDERPSNGVAWEAIPGRTPYTKGSELMNGQTSAWGRAIVALGISADKGIASANEVRNAEERQRTPDPEQVEEIKLRAELAKHGREKFNNDGAAFKEWIKTEFSKESANDLTVPEVRVAIGELTG